MLEHLVNGIERSAVLWNFESGTFGAGVIT